MSSLPRPTLARNEVLSEVTEDESNRSRQVRLGAYTVCLAGLTGAAAVAAGISPTEVFSHLPSLDTQAHLDVPVFDQITRGMVAVNEGLRTSSLLVSGGALAASASVYTLARGSRRVARMRSLARVDYAGSEVEVELANTKPSREKNARKKVRRLLAGTALATTVFVTATAGIEHEVSQGPERVLNRTTSLLSPNDDNPHIFVQNKGAMFMNNSYIDRGLADRFAAIATEQGISVVPFNRELVDIRNKGGTASKTSLVLGVPAHTFNTLSGSTEASNEVDCTKMSVIADRAVGANIGDTITLNDQLAEVVGVTDGISSMNRVGVIGKEKEVASCLQRSQSAPYYGMVIGGDKTQIQELATQEGLHEEGVTLTSKELAQNNRRFWQANGTPILLQMTGYILGFGLIANRNERRATFERDKKELGMMRALGVSIKDLRAVESLRALRESASAAILAGPLAVGLATVVNAAEHGLRVGISAREVAVGFTVTLAAKLFGTHRAISRFAKRSTPYEAMRGN